MYMHVCIYVYIHIIRKNTSNQFSQDLKALAVNINVCMYVCMYVCIHRYQYLYSYFMNTSNVYIHQISSPKNIVEVPMAYMQVCI